MRADGPHLLLSASDLANHLACAHLTELDRAVAEGRLKAPAWHDPALELLQERGLAHEKAYVEHLRATGLTVADLRDSPSVERTLAAMRSGAGAIVQAELKDGRVGGRADVLLRLDEPSGLGGWSYEVVDTKLAQETRGGTVLQLCLYSDLVARVQERAPARMHVVKPGEGFPRETFRCADFGAYYRLVRRRLETVLASPPAATYPDPVPHCEICRWWAHCDQRRRKDDHLSLVAGLRSLHITELERQGIHTLEQLGDAKEPLREKPERGSREAFANAHAQARIQLEGRRAGKPLHELLPPEPGFGLARLPEPCEGDLFFDIESDPFVDGGGLEYLFGVASKEGYRALWALDRAAELRAFEALVDLVMGTWRKHPGMHVYHFSPYEPAAIKRLMGRHGARGADVDRLLRAGKFVDLLAVVRRGLRASVESYSLKELERFFGFRREVELPKASAALRRVACALELRGEVLDRDRKAVEAYNEDDCLATAALRDWLEKLRPAGERPAQQSGDPSDAVAERAADVQEVFDRVVGQSPLLAHMLDYFRREENVAHWEFFRMHELGHEELMDERKAVIGLRFEGGLGGTAKCPIHRYRFPPQEVALDEGNDVVQVGGSKVGKVVAIDQAGRTIDIKKTGAAAALHPFSVFADERVRAKPVDTSLLAFGRSVAERGLDGKGPFRAARDLLLRLPPRLSSPEPLRNAGEDVVDAAIRIARSLDHGVLPIQGPPGTGKTFTGARMIVDLARAGKRIGVTAVSHKVIRNLLEKALGTARKEGVPLAAVHKVSELGEDVPDGLEEVTDNAEALAALDAGSVLGGTAWLWARDDMVESVDYLFVDEAGQMSLAHTLGAARSARNLVLLGDPQQLEQPQRGAHPEGAEVAALVHVLAGKETIADDTGLFLDATWRLHPRICAFTSELYYEGRLKPREGLERQVLAGATPFAGSGLFYAPVEHRGNQNSSAEEVEAVARIVEGLLEGVTWTDRHGKVAPVGLRDILVVAPYNAQVAALTAGLPENARVGTVDKFQGQEAPVVVYSMASSSADDAPRGMGFLFNPNRLNVATSRAQCASILVAAPRLLEPDCRTPEQMRWANGLCRFRELATVRPV
ncbi:MAG TPA: TM0106 family RecB-like putative nuclease [Planctomycetota bacterium]|nr:TM0106 family RecB-like putative nuclease [Planctomycetota bacterium]